jgi:hypothetical protein
MRQSLLAEVKKNPVDRALLAASLALGAALLASDHWFTAVDDECAIIGRATLPAYQTIRLYTQGIGEHEHPPLYDLILHLWLRITSGEMHLLRVPSILFYVLAVFVLAKAGERIGGKGGQVGVFFTAAVSPFGFHFGRLACWYSFSFLIVSLLTLAYLNYEEQRTGRNWFWVFLCGLALIYTSYFGWAILACLALDFVYRNRTSLAGALRPLLGMGVLLFLANLPLLMAFLKEVHQGIKPRHSILSTLLLGAYNLYCMVVSESVAPWFWFLGVPAGMAIIVCLLLVFFYGPPQANRFLIYFGGLFTAMTLLGIIETKRTLLIAAWLILPIGAAIGTLNPKPVGRILMASLILATAIGWYGVFYRKLYAAPHWIEPWPALAAEAAATIRQGGVVVGNNPSFFFYLTYSLMPEKPADGSDFHGFLPVSVQYRGVYNPEQWARTGRPVGLSTLAAKGLNYPEPPGGMDEVMQWLDSRCQVQGEQRLVRDQGAAWKQRFAPSIPQPEWRIEVRRYTCP